MKADFKTKFAYYAGSLLTLLIGICLVFCAFTPDKVFGEGVNFLSLKPILFLAFGVVLIVFSLNLFLIPRKIKKLGNETFVIQQTSSGILRISKKAIESIILKCVGQQANMNLIGIETDIAKDEVVVKITINVAEDAAIPVAVDNLQKQVMAQLNNIAGISQSKVIVSVAETTADETSENNLNEESAETKDDTYLDESEDFSDESKDFSDESNDFNETEQ